MTARRPPELADFPVDLVENVLGYLLGVFLVMEISEGELKDLRTIRIDEVVQRGFVARLEPAQQCNVGLRLWFPHGVASLAHENPEPP